MRTVSSLSRQLSAFAFAAASIVGPLYGESTAKTPPAPVISPDHGPINNSQSITLSDTDSNARIYFTTDGSKPSRWSDIYSQPITLDSFGAVTVRAIAIDNRSSSSISSATLKVGPAPTHVPDYSWKNVQIVGGGFVDGLYFHPREQGLMYAKTDIGGAYRWNKEEKHWIPLLNFVGRFYSGFDQGADSIALDPNDANKLYLAVGEYADSYGQNGALLISNDQGRSFGSIVPLAFKLGSNDNGRNIGEHLVVDPNNAQHLYFGTRLNGLQESTDGGQTWNQVASFPVTGPGTDPEDPEVGVVFEDFIAGSGKAANGETKTVYVGVSSPGTARMPASTFRMTAA
jgi:hypothetical protein